MTNIKKIIEELYLDKKNEDFETQEVLYFYLDKTNKPTYFIKNHVDELRIKTTNLLRHK